ncbi:MAG: signal peptide peptidase SppA [Treponemataceae bacterium]|nr:signal peptide peptidase SppA [Treponemataceae bacterium]
MSDFNSNEEDKNLKDKSIIEGSAEQTAQIIPSEEPVLVEEQVAEQTESPAFQAQPLEVVAQSASFEKQNADEKNKWEKSRGFWVFCFLVAAVLVTSIASAFLPSNKNTENFEKLDISSINSLNKKGKNVGLPKYTHEYIARLDIKGTIQEKNETYNQAWLLDTIDCLINDDKNKGLFIFVDSPGGTVYEADELYLKLCEYKESGRPIYAYFAHMAASGGYYIGCAADYIMTNRNCTTGSIGVIMGPIYTLTGFFEKYGIESTSITAGKNKNMMNINEPLTDEQRKIMQDYIDEAYDQFTGIVAKERDLSIEKVRELADGRVYTAQQALKLKLIDKICSYNDAVEYTKSELFGNEDISFEYIEYEREKSFMELLTEMSSKICEPKADSIIEDMTGRLSECPKGPAYFYSGAF